MDDGAHRVERRWRGLWRDAGAGGDPAPVLHDLLRRLAEPAREYHVLAHVEHCLAELDAARDLALDPLVVELALWFHDAVYSPLARDSEERSAELALHAAASMGLGPERQAGLRRMILATRHDAVPASGDEALVVDIDLAILGQPPERFDAYEEQIRREYAQVPRPLFEAGRARILRSILDRPVIYSTPFFRARYEASARRNLQRSLDAMTE